MHFYDVLEPSTSTISTISVTCKFLEMCLWPYMCVDVICMGPYWSNGRKAFQALLEPSLWVYKACMWAEIQASTSSELNTVRSRTRRPSATSPTGSWTHSRSCRILGVSCVTVTTQEACHYSFGAVGRIELTGLTQSGSSCELE